MKKSFTSAKNVLDKLTIKDIPEFEGLYGLSTCGVVISYGEKARVYLEKYKENIDK